METLLKLLLTLTIITSAVIVSQGLKCYNCVNCNYPNTGTAVQCSAGEVCVHLKTDFNRIPVLTLRGCAKLLLNFVNSCREGAVDGAVTRGCYCDSDLCNSEQYPNNALTRAGGEGTKPGLKCYDCVLGDCNNKKLIETQCSKGFDSCSTSVVEDEILGLPVLSKVCSSGLETGCVTSGNNSLCVCKESLCNGYGTTTFELQQPYVDKGTYFLKVLNVLNTEVEEKQFYRPNEHTKFLRLFYPNENTNKLSSEAIVRKMLNLKKQFHPPDGNTNNFSPATGFKLKLLVLLCIVCIIGCCCLCKIIEKCMASGSKPDITFTPLPQA